MAFTDEQIEYLYKTGKMPQWAYFQQNGKTAQENYNTILLERQNKTLTKSIEKEIEEKFEETVYNALDEILKGLK